MPYFVYKIHPDRQLEQVQAFEKFPEARKLVRAMRQEIGEGDEYTARIIFAKNPDEAERLLMEKREPRPMGEE